MILAWLIIILMLGGILAWITGRINPLFARWISLVSIFIDSIIVIKIWIDYKQQINLTASPSWFIEINSKWVPQFGINFHLALDGLSLILVALTVFLGLLSVLISWKEINERVGFFHFNLLWILAGIIGVFTASDLFLFYFFWEVMLIPMYFLIGIWGHENRIYASYKFFIFTQASGLLMLLAILGLYFIHGSQTGIYTFEYMQLLGTKINPSTAFFLMLGFLIAFVVKLPAVPFHSWLPDAHTEAPTAGSVILAGLLLKTGAYGILRFVIPFFPDASKDFQTVAFILGAAGILYGAMLAFAQTDLKRLVAYSSVSHMGFVLLGAFSFNQLSLQGTVIQLVAHGISTGALFILAGMLQERIHTRDINVMGGLWSKVPFMGGMGLLFALASLGLPGLVNFIAEFLILSGAYQANIVLTGIAALGLIASTIYSLRIVQKVFYGSPVKEWPIPDLNAREILIMGALTVVVVWLGLFPQHVLDISKSSVKKILNSIGKTEVLDNNHNKLEEITLGK
ncbi:MAG TPA: NADH-quinone oxidoreductase subunit M [Ignavibacteriaceae bacterium]|nr:NADH-quinone oxidoreductase subunit M [Ignavibacteriaceae bacterium]